MKKVGLEVDSKTQANIEAWLKGDYDASSKEEILKLKRENPEELVDAFYQTLSFGTGGLRGIMGVGTNRMNRYTVQAATQGLANYILKQPLLTEKHRVLIGFDCRHHSREFAEQAAGVLAGNGIEVFLYKELRPVALISYGLLYHQCIAGVMITASHNPPQYNGYKVYWSYGGQVLPPHDKGIIDEVNKITHPSLVKSVNYPSPLIHDINGEVDKSYWKTIQKLQLHPGDNQTHGKELSVVYTSLHGAGITIIPKALEDWGFCKVTIVERQAKPDGDFPTIKSPNPEDHKAMALGLETLKKVGGDLLLGTDPDTDRLGVVVLHKGEPYYFDGNQIGALLFEHICRSLKHTQTMPPKPMLVKTIVTTELLKTIADHYGVGCLDVLTGFKYIGEKIHQWEEESLANLASHHFLFGAEESYGYLLGTHSRDKDAIISATCICEAALQMKRQGKTLVDLLYEIYSTYGVFREKLLSLTFEGKEGADKMQGMMQKLRTTPPRQFGPHRVTRVEDYLSRKLLHLESGHEEPILLPKSNVLRFWLDNGTKVVIRPSGTEPKIKLYCGMQDPHHFTKRTELEKGIKVLDARLDDLLGHLKNTLMS